LLRILQVPELGDGFAPRVLLAQPLLHELARAHVEVEAQLVLEIRAPP
jgi:hypothetical protein